MRFHFSSFLFGCLVGGAAVALAPRLRPLALEVATASYRLLDQISIRLAQRREDFQDLLAEARARARGWRPRSRPEARA